jgi:PTH1 family peptidyl-tRNA hydrolase
MKLVIGLGNPEPKYDLTRHNIGFLLLDRFSSQLDASWQEKSKFKALTAEVHIGGEKALLVKPTTYYNLTGEAVRALVDFYKLTPATDIVVLHDELALPFGTLRTRLDGSDAGNNGIKSLIGHLGSEFARIRVGIAPHDTAHKQDAVDFVLGKFTMAEQKSLDDIAHHALEFIENFVHKEKEFAPRSVRIQKDQPE